MIMRLRDKILFRFRHNTQGKSDFIGSINHALDGIGYTIAHERNFRIELLAAMLVSIASYCFQVSIMEWCILVVMISLVLVLELVNTAIERCVDLVTKDYRDLAKIAKDVSAGAVLVASMFSVVIGILIFLPKIILIMK